MIKKLIFILLFPLTSFGQFLWLSERQPTEYQRSVMNLSPLVYYPLDEISGMTTHNQMGDENYLGHSERIQDYRPFYGTTGINYNESRTSFHSSPFDANFNRAEGSIALWFRVITKDDWTPTVTARLIDIASDDNNRFVIQISTAGVVGAFRIASGSASGVTVDLSSTKPLDWQSLVLTWSVGSDQLKLYINGVQVGTTQTGLTTFSGTLAPTRVCIGADNTTNDNPCINICISNVAVWTSALSAGNVTTFSTEPTYTNPVTLTHSIRASWDIFSLFGITGSSLAAFAYDVNSDGDKEFVGNIGRRGRFVAVEQDGTVLWDNTVSNTQAEPGRMPFIHAGHLYYADRNHVYCIRLNDGVLIWDETVYGSIPSYITLNETSLGVAVGIETKLDILDYTTGASIGGNYPVTLPFNQWEQSLGVVTIAGNECIVTNDNFNNMVVYNINGTGRFQKGPLAFNGTDNWVNENDWYESFDVTGDGTTELIIVGDDDQNTLQPALEGDELHIYNASGTQVDKYDTKIHTGGLEYHSYAFPNGGKVAYTLESDYVYQRITMVDSLLNPIWMRRAGYPYEGDQCVLYDVTGDGIPEIIYSTEVFSETGGFRVMDYEGNRVLFYTEDSPDEPDDIVDRKGAGVNNRASRSPHYFPDGEFIQFTNRTTDSSCHEVIYLHEWN